MVVTIITKEGTIHLADLGPNGGVREKVPEPEKLALYLGFPIYRDGEHGLEQVAEPEILSVEAAREITKRSNDFYRKERLEKINNDIKTFAGMGDTQCKCYHALNDDIVEILEKAGYKVEEDMISW